MQNNQNAASDSSQAPADQGSFTVSPPAISLPKGGGAIRGIGEKFAANPATGTGSLTIPIATSPGRSGFGPQLSLTYDSGSGNGPFGFGWSLSIPSITRKTDKGLPRYQDAEESDVHILSGAEDLVPVLNDDGSRHEDLDTAPGFKIHRYRPRIEGLFARIERWTELSTGEINWRSISPDNVTTWYGKTDNSRIVDPNDSKRIFSWLICQSYDDKGNAIEYEYVEEDVRNVDLSLVSERNRVRGANRYLKCIRYGNAESRLIQPFINAMNWLFEVVFDYDEGHYEQLPLLDSSPADEQHRYVLASSSTPSGTKYWRVRPDPFSTHHAGFEVRTYRRCRRVLMFHKFAELGAKPCLVRSTEFDYKDIDYSQPTTIKEELDHNGSSRFASFICAVTHCGYVRNEDQDVIERDGVTYVTYLMKSLPPVEFEYSKAKIDEDIQVLDHESLENLPIGLDGSTYRWVDLDGEAVSGILTEQADAWLYKPNLGNGCFGPQQRVAAKPSLASLSNGGGQLLDLAGDGQLDLVTFASPTPGFYERTHDQDWEQFRTFARLPNIRWNEPNLRFVDLTGDGHADVLITEQDAFTWHLSLAEAGFDQAERVQQAVDEETGPRLVFADGTSSIYLADFSGDGLVDLARVRNGEVCYWPNLGYGRFGTKVTMDNAPWYENIDQFSQERIRLADVDGSGTNDIIYIGRDEVLLYFNQSGNRWSEPCRLDQFPHVDNLTSVMTVDLLGNGTACLVWSSPLPGDSGQPLRYIALMDEKPHLLVGMKNNLGAETRVHYAPSTNFYLKDKQDGKPWITRLPFPVHVVERVETYDHISRNLFFTRYAYHHGYFDGQEREFRGFGMVEQWDTEEFAALIGDGTLPEASNLDAASHIPPVRTRTWFHTGIYLGRDRVSNFFSGLVDESNRGEYYREPAWLDDDAKARLHLLQDTVLPADLTLEEEREACRALKGAMLRQETCALDGTDKAEIPYLVTEGNFTIRRLQPKGENRHAVFLTHPRESLSYHYERDPADPRIQHAVTLEVDNFGNVRKELAVGYGRRKPDADLPTQVDHDKQSKLLITYTENQVTNAIYATDAYRTPLPCETCTYEMTGFVPEKNASRFSFDELTRNDFALLESATEIPYEQDADNLSKQKRLIEHVRTLYRKDDLTALSPLGVMQSLALPGESYKLAFTPDLLAGVYQRNGLPLLPTAADVLGGQGPDQGGYRNSKTLRNASLFPSAPTHSFWTKSDEDDHWWIPSGRVLLSPNKNDSAVQELAYARNHFFLPHRYQDPFHTSTFSTEGVLSYDAHDLLMLETRESADNRVTVGERLPDGSLDPNKSGNDYRVLQPKLVMDPNRNRLEVVFDALGLVAGTAVMGKPEDDPQQGDSLDASFMADLYDADIDGFHGAVDPHIPAENHLNTATTRIIYDMDRFYKTHQAYPQEPEKWEPVFAATLAREIHTSDLEDGQNTKIQISFVYSDGFGREIQKKIQAEPGSVPKRDSGGKIIVGSDGRPEVTDHDAAPRWVGSGWTVFNNKGKPVRQYEPFFTDSHHFEFEVKIGVSLVLFYDPLERVVATLHPNHTFEKVVFDPWQQTSWDVNDTLLGDPRTDDDIKGYTTGYFASLSALMCQTWHAQRQGGALGTREQIAASKAAAYANTPTIACFDTLGRPFLNIAHNKVECQDHEHDGTEDSYHARVELDIEGNQRVVRDTIKKARDSLGNEITDELGRIVMRYDYDMLGNRIHQASMEAGERWNLNDVTGKPIRVWDNRGHIFKTAYDKLRRPISQVVRGTDADQSDPRTINQDIQVEKTEYGEGQTNDAILNLRKRVFKVYDNAGVVTNAFYDFKGNLLQTSRTLAEDYKKLYNWGADTVQPSWETFSSRSTYDALDHPLSATSPDGSVYRPTFNEANLLNEVDVNLRGDKDPNGNLIWTPFVTNIDYDARGQRTLIDYGNGVRTTYEYDKWTFRLARMRTIRGTKDASDCTPVFDPRSCEDPPEICRRLHTNVCILQDLAYTYDPIGNITHIQDSAQQIIYFRNRRVEPSTEYTYDAIYRLIEASGREHLGQIGGPPIPPSYSDAPRTHLLHPGDGNAMGHYIERYLYDEVGNFKEISHIGSDPAHPGWTRSYAYEEANLIEGRKKSNRLSSTTIGSGTPEAYAYDAHGNMTRMNHLPLMQWDYRDQLQITSRQVVNNGGTPEITYYVYDVTGQRVRKVTERQAPAGGVPTRKGERIYLGGFEIYREYANDGDTVVLERETLQIMDDKQRIALLETRTDTALPEQLIRYQFCNHLGTASLELDHEAKIISYEEYYPYGNTSYQAGRSAAEVSLKLFRYSGKERDEESGLYYFVLRYYIPWIGRWITTDPAIFVDGMNLYMYVRGNPIRLSDSKGDKSNKVSMGSYGERLNLRKINPYLSDFTNPFPGGAMKLPAEELTSTHFTKKDAFDKAKNPLTLPPLRKQIGNVTLDVDESQLNIEIDWLHALFPDEQDAGLVWKLGAIFDKEGVYFEQGISDQRALLLLGMNVANEGKDIKAYCELAFGDSKVKLSYRVKEKKETEDISYGVALSRNTSELSFTVGEESYEATLLYGISTEPLIKLSRVESQRRLKGSESPETQALDKFDLSRIKLSPPPDVSQWKPWWDEEVNPYKKSYKDILKAGKMEHDFSIYMSWKSKESVWEFTGGLIYRW